MRSVFLKFSHTNLKFSRSLFSDLPLQQKFKASCYRLYHDKILSFHNVAGKGKLKRILIPATLGVVGLAVFKSYHSVFGEHFFSDIIPKVHASSGDNLKQASNSNNFIADAVDIAAPAVVYLRVRR